MLTIGILLANVVVCWHESNLRDWEIEAFLTHYALAPARLLPLTLASSFPLFTSMFLHASWSHLIGNMWFLWIFGDDVENRMGRLQFLGFYLVSGLAAHAAQVGTDPTSLRPCVGASGAVAGVMGAYFFMFPTSTITSVVSLPFPRVHEVPAALFLGIWVLLQVGAAMSGSELGIAWYAHLGGFVAGCAVALLATMLKSEDDD